MRSSPYIWVSRSQSDWMTEQEQHMGKGELEKQRNTLLVVTTPLVSEGRGTELLTNPSLPREKRAFSSSRPISPTAKQDLCSISDIRSSPYSMGFSRSQSAWTGEREQHMGRGEQDTSSIKEECACSTIKELCTECASNGHTAFSPFHS